MRTTCRGLLTIALAAAVSCNVTAAPAPLRTLPPASPTRPPSTPTVTYPPPPTDLPAQIPLPRQLVPNTVYDLGQCTGNVPVVPPDGFVFVVYAFTMQSKPIENVVVKADSGASLSTDAKGIAQVSVPGSTKQLTLTRGDTVLTAPVFSKLGECHVLVAYFN